MLLVHVQHFLNEEGKDFFPIFIREMKIAMIEYNKGFMTLRQLIKENKPCETHFLLEYENFELLKEFSQTETHSRLINKLKTYQLKKQFVEKFFTD